MSELSLNPAFLQNLILRTRGAMLQSGHTTDDEGNLTDDDNAGPSHGERRGMSDQELIDEIDDLEPDQQAELVALLWIGRGDMEPEEWDDAITLAFQRLTKSTATYLLSHPHLAEHWDDALDRMFDGTSVVEDGEF